MGQVLSRRLARLAEHPHVAQTRGRGLLQAVELVRGKTTLEPFPAADRTTLRVITAALLRGVLFYPGGSDPARDVVCLGPPFTISEEELDHAVEVLEKAIDSAAARSSAA
jgi:adenosylmethionine-8-amino-7-oxononanoate aminotransferase